MHPVTVELGTAPLELHLMYLGHLSLLPRHLASHVNAGGLSSTGSIFGA